METGQAAKIKDNIARVKEKIQKTAVKAGRNPDGISLIAVTKDKPAAVVKTLAENGISKIGENYLQEASFKIDLLKELNIEWHMIGNIQRNKEKNLAYLFDVIHSVGSKQTARELNRSAEQMDKVLPMYLELNVSGESTKHGWIAKDEAGLANLAPDVEEILNFPALEVLGLMTMAPYSRDPEDSRPYFRRMREISEFLHSQIPGASFPGLSMGMSGDYQVAIEEGATIVRIGTALVGPR